MSLHHHLQSAKLNLLLIQQHDAATATRTRKRWVSILVTVKDRLWDLYYKIISKTRTFNYFKTLGYLVLSERNLYTIHTTETFHYCAHCTAPVPFPCSVYMCKFFKQVFNVDMFCHYFHFDEFICGLKSFLWFKKIRYMSYKKREKISYYTNGNQNRYIYLINNVS